MYSICLFNFIDFTGTDYLDILFSLIQIIPLNKFHPGLTLNILQIIDHLFHKSQKQLLGAQKPLSLEYFSSYISNK